MFDLTVVWNTEFLYERPSYNTSILTPENKGIIQIPLSGKGMKSFQVSFK